MEFEEKFFSSKRITYLALMFAATYAVTIFLCIMKDTALDIIISVLFLDLIFFALLVLGLATKRKRGLFAHNQVTYGKLCFAYVVSFVLVAGFSFMPEFTRPMILVAFLLYMFSQENIAVYISVYLSLLLSVLCESTLYEFASLVLVCTGGVFIVTLIKERKQLLYASFSLLALGLIVPCIFYYLACGELDAAAFGIGCIGSVATCILALFMYHPIQKYVSGEEEAILDVIVMDNYSLVVDIKAYSLAEFNHAVKVMNLARKCARASGANEKVCAAGGFYYRVGKMEGEPYVENGIRLALNKGFPEGVVKILAEYNGEERQISTIESAIVHMVSTVVTKLEQLGKDTMQSSWNQNVVIYQTLNEISSTGFYDKSGLTMNQFLKTREILAVEENLI